MLNQNIRDDLKEAMKAKDDVRVQTLRGALAAFTNELVAKMKKPTDALTDDEMIVVLKRLAKQRQDSIEQFTAGGRPELAEKEAKELTYIKAYIPAGASKEEIEKVARAKKEEMNVDKAGIGKLMGAVMKEFAGRADGSDVKEVVTKLFD
ncbi:GatB/YqeY domain-containing protein [bacterium]|nr:GatB/YqeY domain-containing protein [bacterium]